MAVVLLARPVLQPVHRAALRVLRQAHSALLVQRLQVLHRVHHLALRLRVLQVLQVARRLRLAHRVVLQAVRRLAVVLHLRVLAVHLALRAVLLVALLQVVAVLFLAQTSKVIAIVHSQQVGIILLVGVKTGQTQMVRHLRWWNRVAHIVVTTLCTLVVAQAQL